MKKKTAQPRPKQRKTSESEKKKGLIAQKKTTGSSERAKSALDNRSHRTLTRKLAAITLRLWKTGERFDASHLTIPTS